MSRALTYDGCHLHPHCLSCPREWCIEDEPERAPAAPYTAASAESYEIAMRLVAAGGLTVTAIAREAGVTPRTVKRWKRQANIVEPLPTVKAKPVAKVKPQPVAPPPPPERFRAGTCPYCGVAWREPYTPRQGREQRYCAEHRGRRFYVAVHEKRRRARAGAVTQ